MTLTPPFTLTGEAGKALGAVGYSLAALGVQDAVLNLRSLDADTLQFTLRDNGNRPAIPDDGQWLTLKDDAGQVLFTGIAKRSFRFPERVYTYEVSNVYRGLMETALIDGDRAFVLYSAPELGGVISDILARGVTAGLPIQAPATLPDFYPVPKMAFRASSVAGALEDALKWAPDTVTRMDYATTPPTLEFATRTEATSTVIDLDGEGHKATGIELTPYPEARALAVAFAYARRDGDFGVNISTQKAGDDNAEARRKISLYLSGLERADMLVSESLTKALYAANAANLALTALGESITSTLIADAVWLPSWTTVKDDDLHGGIANALVVTPSFTMVVAPGSTTRYNGAYVARGEIYGVGFSGGSYTYNSIAFHVTNNSLTPQTGWHAINPGVFTADDLALVGASSSNLYAVGDMMYEADPLTGDNDDPQSELHKITDHRFRLYGTDNLNHPAGETRRFYFYRVKVPVLAVNVAPSIIAAAVASRDASTDSSFLARAEFVEAPPDLAANYFARQDWTPYKGSISMSPTAPDFPAPGDFLSVRGEGLPTEWATMKVPVSELSVDLRTGAATVAIGPSPRMDFSSLVDRLRIPPEDNYQPG